ncbi:MAG: hypothetical protein IRY97_00800 [Thermomicrobiaceae bacterium]|nr:hypothetical protein [Thermomicrobiaceae bacterium]
MALFGRRKAPVVERPKHTGPTRAGAWLFTLRSVPRHYVGIKAAIESTGEARVYFGEPLAYIKGRGVSLFRVEATGFDFLRALYDWWRETERDEAFIFDIDLYVYNTQWLASLREHTPEEIAEIIRANAPTYQPPAGA